MIKTKTALKCVAAVMTLAAGSALAQASLVSAVGPGNAPRVGDSFQVQLVGTDFSPIVGGGLNVSFSSDLFELTSVQIDSAWSFWSDPGIADNTLGTLTNMSFNVWGFIDGSFAIASLEFMTKATGSGSIALSDSAVFPFATPEATVLPVSYLGTIIQVSAVPEAGTLALMILGLGATGLAWRRRQSV